MTTKDRSILFEGGRVGILLIHGLGGTPLEMKSLGRGLVDTGATVLCCQLAGHCGTEEDLIATRWQDWYDSAEQALLRLQERCDTVIVGGLSMGGLIAARLAAFHPKIVDGVIMLASAIRYDGWSAPWYRGLLQLALHTPLGRNRRYLEQPPYGVKDDRIRQIIQRALFSGDSSAAGLPATPGASVLELTRLIKAAKKVLPHVRQKTLIVHAREDDCASLSNAFYLQKNLGGLVEMLVLDDSYHLVTVDRQRHLVLKRATEFVLSLGSLASAPQEARPQRRLHVV